MGWLIGILLVIAGAIIGFFASRFWLGKGGHSASLAAQLEDTKQQFDAYRRDVSEHMATALQLSEQVTEIQSKLSRFLGESENFLQSEKEWQQPLPFFSDGTMKQLRQSNLLEPEPERRKTSEGRHDEAPRDYSEPGSGLFSPIKPKE
ncbi:YhcB family protein [Aliidiomarina quisquiliarum]|uniref:YhcB family protein n=1 Tax=Aliidiomarina quisquiliarum TaxID=2938947 RepID=UPI00208EE761|nr:DUF1043 family protein [Aliidiomarina quisquiliarum]MCO4321440.1 YhcB family protein [Aliidiomarina quisquiliarum]